jgi:hypothetical protein
MRTSIIALFALTMLLASCGINSGLINQFTVYGNNTQVVLDKANYKVIGTVEGEASNAYFLGIGGKNKLIAKAKSNLFKNADLQGKSRAIINMSVEQNHSAWLLMRRHTVTMSGTIIEFQE